MKRFKDRRYKPPVAGTDGTVKWPGATTDTVQKTKTTEDTLVQVVASSTQEEDILFCFQCDQRQ